MSAAAMLDQFVAAAQANPLSVVLAALVGIVVAWLLFAGPAKKAGPKKSWSEDRFPAAEAKKVAEEFTLQSLRSDFFNNPFKYYHALQDHAPIKWLGPDEIFITRYADATAVYNGHRQYTSGKKVEFAPKYGVDSPLYEHHTNSLVFNDPPLHTRVRRILLGALTEKNFKKMEPNIQKLVDGLLDQAEKKGRIDLIEDFASAIPIEVIGNLLDVPHDEREPLRQWSLDILGALEPVLTKEQMDAGNRAVSEFLVYLRDLVRRRREKPGDPEIDLLTRLINGDANGDKLTEVELLQNCVFLLNAGHETTTNGVSNGIVALWENQDQLDLLKSDIPKHIDNAIDEILRFQSPNQLGNRQTNQVVTLNGTTLQPGTRVHICIGAVNRDPAQFENPDKLDITRFPNKHYAFASGVHRCLGEKLAKLEMKIAITSWIKRFPNFRIIEDEIVRSPRARFRGFITVPVDVRG